MGHPQTRADTVRRAAPFLCGLSVAAALCCAEMSYISVSQCCADWLGLPDDQIIGRPVVGVTGASRNAGMG
jgi:hypothetical protein